MTDHEHITHSADETMALGRKLAPALKNARMVILRGDLGTGKTTLVKGIAEGLEERPGPSAAGWIDVPPRAFGQCPKRPAVAIFRTLFFQPPAIVAHEISKPAGIRIPGVLDERGEA